MRPGLGGGYIFIRCEFLCNFYVCQVTWWRQWIFHVVMFTRQCHFHHQELWVCGYGMCMYCTCIELDTSIRQRGLINSYCPVWVVGTICSQSGSQVKRLSSNRSWSYTYHSSSQQVHSKLQLSRHAKIPNFGEFSCVLNFMEGPLIQWTELGVQCSKHWELPLSIYSTSFWSS